MFRIRSGWSIKHSECVVYSVFTLCLYWSYVGMFYQIFKDHMIDGETLPLLSEEHLLDTLGLKLGPALKIRSQVHKLKHAQNEGNK